MSDALERALEHVSFEPMSGCWLWIGTRGGHAVAYGRFWSNKRFVQAHHATYEAVKGPVPPGLTLDHLCRTPCCVNPAHLEAVTMRENILRGTSFSARNVLKTHCPKGHLLKSLRLYKDRLHKVCRECQREDNRRRRERRKADAA